MTRSPWSLCSNIPRMICTCYNWTSLPIRYEKSQKF